jgi:ATP-dependent protease ClpP protease subunit
MKWMKTTKHNNATDDTSGNPEQSQQSFVLNASDFQIPQTSCGIRVFENQIYFYGDITQDACLELNRILNEIDLKYSNLHHILKCDTKPIIHLHIQTCGGEIFSAFSTVDTIRNLNSDVYTYVDGLVASAGTLMSCVGHKRIMGTHAHLLIHQLSSEAYGTYADLQASIDNCTNLMKLLKTFYKKNTKIPMKKLDELMTKDIYLTPEECLEYNIIDEIR